MGRSILAEESVRQSIDNLFTIRSGSQCGLIVGQRGGNKDFVSLLVPTPLDGSGDDIPSVEWSVDHALQVSLYTI